MNPTEIVSDGMLDVRGASELLGISRSFLYELMRNGTLPSATLGRRRLVPRKALIELLAKKLVTGGGEHAR